MSAKKTQVFLVHGGRTFRSREGYLECLRTRDVSIEKKIRWKDEFLDQALGEAFHVIRPRMPLQDNAKYQEWSIHFERHIPKLNDHIILVGVSLGGIFLAKYLSENLFPKKILSAYLVAAPFDDAIPTEDLAGGFELASDLSLLEKNAGKLHLLFSKNDIVVPLDQADKYAQKLPQANVIVYDHIKGHFEISEFPEIVDMIKRDIETQ